MKKTIPAALVCLALALGLGGCTTGGETTPTATPTAQGELTQQSIVGFYFDTVVNMTVYWQDDAPLKAALEECRRYENLLSKTVEGSDVWKINHANGQRVPISEDTRDILEKALAYSELSGGRFDITVEPCVALWDFTGDASAHVLPDADALAAAAAKVDYTQIDLNEDGVQLPAGMTVDLGAIAKGYITDRVADFLEAQGVTSGVLNFGGNVLTIGVKPNGEPWNIGVQDPAKATGESIAIAHLDASAVVTSGIYERGFDLNGTRYHHLLDTATGWPIQNDLAGVSIVAEDAFDGDALSTTLFAMGAEEGLKLAESLEGVEALFITREEQITMTSGLADKVTLLENGAS